MLAYKGFTHKLTARLGAGEYQFNPRETVMEESSKTARTGFHCCENPLDCLAYYPLGKDNRYFQVNAAGSIDEDDSERIACTELTLLKELTVKELAGYGMIYMIEHPMRRHWKQVKHMCTVAESQAEAEQSGAIAIARGGAPRVKGVKGSILGLIAEPEPGNITAARLFICGENQEGKWYTLKPDRELEVCHETESC